MQQRCFPYEACKIPQKPPILTGKLFVLIRTRMPSLNAISRLAAAYWLDRGSGTLLTLPTLLNRSKLL
jgi:hypothetical protein